MEEKQLQIDLRFSEQLRLDDYFIINLKDENNNQYSLTTTFVERRLGPNQTVIGSDLNYTIQNLKKSIELDYGSLFTSEITDSEIKLLATRPNWKYIGSITNPPEFVLEVIPNEIVLQNFTFKSVEFLPFTPDRCNKIIARVKTTLPFDNYCVNNTCFIHNADTLDIEYFRGSSFMLSLGKFGDYETINIGILTPQLIEDGYDNIIKLNILNGLNGGSVTIDAPFANQLEHRFSLDNINWQSSNTFSGLLEGLYTAYIEDKFGCKRTKDFKIDPYTVNIIQDNTYHYISKSNSIRFAKRVNFDATIKTDENTLSCEMDVIKPYKQIQVFKNSDVVKTQFKSNFKINKAFVLEGNNEYEIAVQRYTKNTDLKDSRTAIKYNLTNGKTGIYFLNGTVFDFDTGAPLEPYELNGYLPEWAKKGNRFSMENKWFEILDTFYDENKNADVIAINNVYNGIDTGTIVKSNYNREDYEVYEFSVWMSNYLDKKIQVKIEFNKGLPGIFNSKVNFLSEQIHVVKECNMVELRYKNSKNTDIVYSTGIEHLLRLPIELVSGKDISTSENHKTDDQVVLLDANIYESNVFKFEPLTLELWRKLKIALSHDNVYIDGIGYVREDDFETEGPLGQTNLYVLSATMIKNGHSYSNRGSNDIIIIDNNKPLPDISGFINVKPGGFIEK